MSKILVATEKPFAKPAVQGIEKILTEAGMQLALLEKYTDKSQLLDAVKDAEALIIRSDKITAEVIKAAPKLKIIVRAGAGYDNVDLDAATAQSIVVMNTPGQNANAVAELAIGMMVFLNRNQFNGTAGTELRGKTLGIHGYGNIGKLTAGIAKGFGMAVHAYDPFVDAEAMKADGVQSEQSAEALYSKSQFVSVNLPANDKTKDMINEALLSNLPENGTLVNTARKEIIDEAGLLKMFAKRGDFRYISDIAPDCKEDILNQYSDRSFFTPKKMGAQTKEANTNAGLAAARQIVGYLKNNDKTFQVN